MKALTTIRWSYVALLLTHCQYFAVICGLRRELSPLSAISIAFKLSDLCAFWRSFRFGARKILAAGSDSRSVKWSSIVSGCEAFASALPSRLQSGQYVTLVEH